jgi:chemotaxis protein MotB
MAALAARRSRHRSADIWPGFVDALATLVMVIVFVLMIFTLFQYHLRDVISGRDQALARLSQQMSELAATLAMERRASADLRTTVTQLSTELQASTSTRDRLTQELAAANTRAQAATAQAAQVSKQLEDAFKTVSADKEKIEVQLRELDALRRNIETLIIMRRELEAKINEQGTEIQKGQTALSDERKLSEDAKARADLMTRQLDELRKQLELLNATLESSEKKTAEQQVQIADLGRRLNLALASKVEELARYRSEFFGKLREVLGERTDIRVVGDRFVFQAEVLFASGSAELEPQGREQMDKLATALREIAGNIPADVNWVLQVDGHTDRRPIQTVWFPSNWELSSARAIAVVKFLMTRGIPAERLTAAGFAEFQPIDARDDEIGWRRNRRIEIKFTSR